MIRYEAIHKDKVESQIQQHYHKEIKQLQTLGFDELYFSREVAFAFSALVFFWLIPYLNYKKEIYRIEMPLRVVLFNPLLLNHKFDTYAYISSLGATFSTLFTDDTILISTSFKLKQLIRPDLKYYCYSPEEDRSFPETWDNHVERLYEIETKGRETRQDLSLENYEALAWRSSKIQVFRR